MHLRSLSLPQAGLDADLIMLGLATHEPHFSLLREQIDFMQFRHNQFGTKSSVVKSGSQKWQLLHLGILREYLEVDMRPPPNLFSGLSFKYDGERVIDDFVLLTALCGNDFMPHLPSIDIGEGALDTIIATYRDSLPEWGGWLSEAGVINLPRLEGLLHIMGSMEAQVLTARAAEAERHAKRAEKDARRNALLLAPPQDAFPAEDGGVVAATKEPSSEESDDDDNDVKKEDISAAAKAAAEKQLLAAVGARISAERRAARAASGDVIDDGTDDSGADFSLEDGDFKGRYYLEKFGISYQRGSAADAAVLSRIVRSYAEALQWTMLYYFRGVPSWGWFYPFHFAPMTSDLQGFATAPVAFKLGRPFRPFQQLLGCLPAASAKFLPATYRPLMTDASSPLAEFYPSVENIKIDMDGKRNAWEGVALIPFIRETAMFSALDALGPDALTPAETARNAFGVDWCFWYDAGVTDTLPSSNPDVFPSLAMCATRAAVLINPNMPVLAPPGAPAEPVPPLRTVAPEQAAAAAASAGPEIPRDIMLSVAEGVGVYAHIFSAAPPKGCVVPSPGYPTLHSLPLSAELRAVSMNVFGMKSRKVSMILETLVAGARGGDAVMDEEDESLGSAADFAAGVTSESEGGAPGESATFASSRAHRPVFSTGYAAATTVVSGAARPADAVSQGLTGIKRASARAIAPLVLGKVAYVEWPHLREAFVYAVSDASEVALWSSPDGAETGSTLWKRHNGDAQGDWARREHEISRGLLSGFERLATTGIQVGGGGARVLIHATKMMGMRRDAATGALERVWGGRGSAADVCVPASLVLLSHPSPDTRFAPRGPMDTLERFPIGERVVALRGPARGALARIAAVAATTVSLDYEEPPAEPPFGANLAAALVDRYFNAASAAAALKISQSTLNRITASIVIRPLDYDVGLNLKISRDLFLPGYVRSVAPEAAQPAWASGATVTAAVLAAPRAPRGAEGHWEYTERAVALVAAYQTAFPSVFDLLEANPSADYPISRFPGGGPALLKVCTWLKQLETKSRPLAPVTSTYMSPAAASAVEKAADAFSRNAAKARGGAPPPVSRVDDVPLTDVFRPEVLGYAVGSVGEGEGRALGAVNVDGPAAVPLLGDRVVNLSFRQAPLGARATVIAIHAHSGYVEAVFDAEFVGGGSLGGACSNGRGALVPWSSLMCPARPPPSAEANARAAARIKAGGNAAALFSGGDEEDLTAEERGRSEFPRGRRGVGDNDRGAGAGRGPHAAAGGKPPQQLQASAVTRPAPRPVAAPRQAPAASAAAPARSANAAPAFSRPDPFAAAGSGGSGGGATNDDEIAAQVAFYFSDQNMKKSEHMRKLVSAPGGWVPLATIATWNMMKTLANGDVAIIARAAVKAGLQVSNDGSTVRRNKAAAVSTAAPAGAPAQNQRSAAPAPYMQSAPVSVADLFAVAAASSASKGSVAAPAPASGPSGATPLASATPADSSDLGGMASYWTGLLASSPSGANDSSASAEVKTATVSAKAAPGAATSNVETPSATPSAPPRTAAFAALLAASQKPAAAGAALLLPSLLGGSQG